MTYSIEEIVIALFLFIMFALIFAGALFRMLSAYDDWKFKRSRKRKCKNQNT